MKLYTAKWCSSCTGIKKSIEDLKLNVEVLDIDLLNEVPVEVRSIPTLEDGDIFITGAAHIFSHLKGCSKDATMPNT